MTLKIWLLEQLGAIELFDSDEWHDGYHACLTDTLDEIRDPQWWLACDPPSNSRGVIILAADRAVPEVGYYVDSRWIAEGSGVVKVTHWTELPEIPRIVHGGKS